MYDREFHDQEHSKLWVQPCRGVEEDTPATDCQTHQEYASSVCGLTISAGAHTRSSTGGYLSVNEIM